MNINNIRYITGLIRKGKSDIIGYCIVTPGVEKREYIMQTSLRQYMLKTGCIIANATIDSFGRAIFKTHEDEKSYIHMNSSGFILGFDGIPVSKLHPGNKTIVNMTTTASTSYIIIDCNNDADVVSVMNVSGIVKSMSIRKLVSVVKEGLIISNAKIVDNKVELLNRSLRDILEDKPVQTAQPRPVQTAPVQPKPAQTTPVQPKPVQTVQQPAYTIGGAIKPPSFSNASAPVKPPVQAQPVQTVKPHIQPTVKPPVQPSAQPIRQAQSTTPTIKQAQPVAAAPSQPKHITPNKTVIDIDFAEYTDAGHKIFKIHETPAGEKILMYNYISYTDEYAAKLDSPTKVSLLLDVLQKIRLDKSLAETTQIRPLFNKEPIFNIDYNITTRDKYMSELNYVLDFNKINLVDVKNIIRCLLIPTKFDTDSTLLVLPNKYIDSNTGNLADSHTLHASLVYTTPKCGTPLVTVELKSDIVIKPHPRANITETADYDFLFCPATLFSPNGKKIIVDLRQTKLRFIAKNAMIFEHNYNYAVLVPNTCKRLHNDALLAVNLDFYAREIPVFRKEHFSIPEDAEKYKPFLKCLQYFEARRNTKFDKYTIFDVLGNNIERLDIVGRITAKLKMSSCVNVTWQNLTNISGASILRESLPSVDYTLDVDKYLAEHKNKSIVQDLKDRELEWKSIGGWSDIDKGKISVSLTSKNTDYNASNYLKFSSNRCLIVDGTVKKCRLNCCTYEPDYEEYVQNDRRFEYIRVLKVEEGVEELKLHIADPKKNEVMIEHLILPSTLKVLSISSDSLFNGEKYVENIYVAKGSIMSRMDIKQLFGRSNPVVSICQYDNGYVEHEKNMLTNMMGLDMSYIEDVTYSAEEIKNNLALCGITF